MKRILEGKTKLKQCLFCHGIPLNFPHNFFSQGFRQSRPLFYYTRGTLEKEKYGIKSVGGGMKSSKNFSLWIPDYWGPAAHSQLVGKFTWSAVSEHGSTHVLKPKRELQYDSSCRNLRRSEFGAFSMDRGNSWLGYCKHIYNIIIKCM